MADPGGGTAPHPDPAATSSRWSAAAWLSERRRAGVATVAALLVGVPVVFLAPQRTPLTPPDAAVVVLLVYLPTYLVLTSVAFARASDTAIARWAEREDRGTFVQRYLLGTAPGPGVSVFVAAAALVAAVVWLPGHGGTSLPAGGRVALAIALVVIAWLCVLVSFAVTFCADNLLEEGRGLDVPGSQHPHWSDYVYFATAVMTTFGTTDVTVTSRTMRRTVTVNALIAFVYNTVIVATVVSVLAT